jgi:molybdate transport system substrate-binding protein
MPLKPLLACLFCWILSLAAHADEQNLLIYCGITMVRPITELSRTFELRERIRVTISQGGSEDLYQSAKKSRIGDLYLPGEPSYRDKHLAEGLLGDYKIVGYNQMALFVAKGNRKDLTIIIGNAESGSVGQETKAMLDRANIYPKVVNKAAALMPDSRAINLAMKNHEADATLNWRATAFFPDNAKHIDAIDLDPQSAKPQALLLNLLTSSKNQFMARKFMDFIAAEEGQAIFRKHGFLDNKAIR